jgi:hypothetical protein
MQTLEIDPVSSNSSVSVTRNEPASPDNGAITYLRTHPKYKLWLIATVAVSSLTLLLGLLTQVINVE